MKNDGPVLSDDAIRELLEQRAGRSEIDGRLAAIRSAAAATPQGRSGRLRFGFARVPVAGAAGLASAGVLIVLVALAAGWRLPATGTGPGASGPRSFEPSGGPPATPIAAGATEPVTPLTVDLLNALLRADPQSLSGRQLVITGIIGRPLPVQSCPPAACDETVVLRGSQPVLTVKPAGTPASDARVLAAHANDLSGPFAAHLVDGRTLDYEGPVVVGTDGGALLPSQLPDPSDQGVSTEFHLVRGWIAGIADPSPCPLLRFSPPPGPQYGCGRQAILSDGPYQPVTANSFVMPPTGILVQNDAYQDFAPQPIIERLRNGGPGLTQPEQATFLVRVAPSESALCPAASPCPLITLWAIQARVDPWSGPPLVAAASPSPEPSAPSNAAPPAVSPLTVNQLNAYMAMNSQSPAGRQLVVSGTILLDMTADFCVQPCTGWYLADSNPRLWVEPGQARGSPPWKGGTPVTGAFAAVLTDNLVLDYQAPVSLAPDGSDRFPSQLPNPTLETATSGDWLVQAWLVGSLVAPACPLLSISRSADGSEYGCGAPTFLSDTEVPLGAVTSLTSPLTGVQVQNGAYAAFAPSFDASDPVPEQATFLVRTVFTGGCGACLVTSADYHWEILTRIDPWPVPALP